MQDTRTEKKRPKVYARRELAVVSIAMVAAVAGIGGLLGGATHVATEPQQVQAAQVSQKTPVTQKSVSSAAAITTPAAQAPHQQIQSKGS